MSEKKKGVGIRRGVELNDAAEKNLPLRREELALVMRCGVETVSHWVKRGMPCTYLGKVKKPTRGSKPLFRYHDCIAWLDKTGR